MPIEEKEMSGCSRTEKHNRYKKHNKRTNNPKVKDSGKKKGCFVVLCVLLILAVLTVGVIAFAFMNIKPPSLENMIHHDGEEDSTRADGIYSVLVVGTDKVGLNTDTILVASLDSINNTASVMSIPRDTMSNVKRTVKKINAAYSIGAKNGKGNIDNLKAEVADLIGFEVDNYVVVNLTAFEELIDAIGGVTIDVPRNMNYDDPYQNLHIHIEKGLQTLNGQQAVGFVRYRSGYAEGDIGRVKAQQLFIKALVDQVATPASIAKLPTLINIVLDNMDTDLTNGELLWFGKEVLEIDMETNFNMFILPGQAQYVNKLSYYLPNESEILEIVNQYFNPSETPITTLNVVDLAAIRQKEAARQAALSEEQRRQEEALKQKEETEAGLLEENGMLIEGNEGDNAQQSNELGSEDPSGIGNETDYDAGGDISTGQKTDVQPSGVPDEEIPESNNNVSEIPENSSNDVVQPGGIPGEVLKQDVV